MAVPRRKTSPSRRGMRRSADALKAPTYVEDKDLGELRRPHHIDLKSGLPGPSGSKAEVQERRGLRRQRRVERARTSERAARSEGSRVAGPLYLW